MQLIVGYNTLSKAKISNFSSPIMHKYVLRLYISMYHTMTYEFNEACTNFLKMPKSPLFREVPLTLNSLLQVLAIAQLLNNVVIMLSLQDIDDLDDVLRVELLHDFDLEKHGIS